MEIAVPKVTAKKIAKKAVKKSATKKKTSNVKGTDRSHNVVLLRGRVGASANERTLPSGDKVSEFRLIVGRSSGDGVDTLEVAAWKMRLRNRCAQLKTNDWVEVSGEIRRRFWRGAAGLASRWQIEASEIKVL